MRVILLITFLTLVVSGLESFAAPTSTTTLPSTPLSGDDDPYLASFKPNELKQYSEYKIQFALGYQGGYFLEGGSYLKGTHFDARFMPLINNDSFWDGEFIFMNDDKILGLGAGRRWYSQKDQLYKTYFRLGLNTFLKSSDQIVGFFESRRWRLRAAMGFGDTFTTEAGLGVAVTGADLYIQFGYNLEF